MDNVVLDDYGSVVGANAIAVYSVLARHASNDDRACRIGINRIAEKCGIARNTVKVGLRKLADAGLIEIVERFDGEWQHAHEYVLLEVPPRSADDPGQDLTGVKSRPGPRSADDQPWSGDGHFNKDLLDKDSKLKTDRTFTMKELSEAYEELRRQPLAPSKAVAVEQFPADVLDALRSSMFRRDVERLEDERRKRGWLPQ